MRLHYLEMVLLASALAANTPGESKRLLVTHSSTSDRDDGSGTKAINDQMLKGADDEERVDYRSWKKFLTDIVKTSASPNAWRIVNSFNKNVEMGASPSKIFKTLNVSAAKGNLLANDSWLLWAFFVYKSNNSRLFNEAIIRAMTTEYGFETLVRKLFVAAADSETKSTAEELINCLIEQGKSHELMQLAIDYGNARMVMQMLIDHYIARQTRPMILFKKLRLHKKVDNIFKSWMFKVWSKFMKKRDGEQYAQDPLGTELIIFKYYYGVADLLKMLISPDNAFNKIGQEYLNRLKTSWLEEKKPPSIVVSMLALDEAHDHLFLDLQINEPSVMFWKNYLTQFNLENPSLSETMMQALTNAVGFARAWTMIRAAIATADKKTSSFANVILEDQFQKWIVLQANTPSEIENMLIDEMKTRQSVPKAENNLAIDGICKAYLWFYMNSL